MAKRRKLDPRRFQQKDEKGLFSFDPIRRDLLKWGAIAGAAGGSLMLIENLLSQIAGVVIVVLVSNYHINRAAQRIPRWHATIVAFIGVMVAMFGVIIVGTIVLAYLNK